MKKREVRLFDAREQSHIRHRNVPKCSHSTPRAAMNRPLIAAIFSLLLLSTAAVPAQAASLISQMG